MKNYSLIKLLLVVFLFLSGCGYTTSSLLPKDLDSIHVDSFKNKIDPTKEISDRRVSYTYRPGLEIDITRSVIDGFIFDRHLDIEGEKNAALLMKGALTDFREYPLSYDKGNNIDEFRIEIYVDIELYNNKTGKLMWREKGFMGQSSYNVSGPNAKPESEGIKDAVNDLAARIVERTVESW